MQKLTFIGIPLSLLLGLVLSAVGLTTRAAAADFIVTSNDEAELRIFIGKAEVLYVLSGGSEASTITFAANVTGTITLTSGELVIKSRLTIIGPGANLLTISGNNASRVFYISPNNTVTLEGLTVSGGNGVGATNTGNGGGIYNEGTLTITNSTVSGNAVAGFSGSGGGIFNFGTLTLTGSTVSGNSAVNAGGILNSGPLTITNSAVSNNSVTVNGGGIASAGVIGSLTVTNSTVSGNSAGGYGGGFIFNGAPTLRLINSTVSGNSARADGGGFTGQGSVDATNSTVTGNRADSDGDAFGAGGGFHSTGRKLNNTIVAGNFRGAGSTPDDINGTISTANNSLIGDAATSGGIANGVNGNKVGFAVSVVLNTTLANNGGPTLTHALVPGSPALNAGSNALALDAANQPLTTDQRGAGFPRTIGGTVDIGAFEVQVNAPCPAGKYDNGSGCVDADPGHYVPNAGATAQIACAEGTYQPDSGAISCIDAAAGNYVASTAAVAQTQCAVGSFQSITGSSSCTLASAGNYVASPGATTQIQCAMGTYQPDTASSSCTLASAGNYVASPGATTQTQCAVGSFQSITGSSSCTLASAGNYVASPGATTQTQCAVGSFQSNTGSSSCTLASAGNYVASTGAIAQTACAAGFYQTNSGAINCLAAAPGNYVSTSGAAAQTSCPLGTYQPNAGAISCTSASAGHFVNQLGSIGQTACQPGYYQPNTGAVLCNAADAGYYVPVAASIAQLACQTGYTSPPAAIACTLQPYNFVGFLQPVDNFPIVNVATAGSAIPIKFGLGGYQGMAIFFPGYPVSQLLSCNIDSQTDMIEEVATGSASSLSYDAATGQYKYVWKTDKAWKGQCRKLVVKVSDGTIHEASFQFK